MGPPRIKEFFAMLSFFNLNLDLMAPECSYPKVSYSVKWSMIMSLPVFATMFFLGIHAAIYIKKRFIQGRTKNLHKHVHLMVGTSLISFYYFYLYLTKTSLDIFNCSPTEPVEYNAAGEPIEYLEVTFAQCDKPGGLHRKLVGPAAFFFTIYSIGFPTLVGAILYKNREKCKADQLLRAKRTGNSRSTNPECYDFRKKYHKIYEMYKPNYYFWSAAVMGRKLVIACLALLFRRSPVFLLASSLLTLFIAYALQVRFQPFMHDAEYQQVIEQGEREQAQKAKQFGQDIELDSASARGGARRGKVQRLGGTSAEYTPPAPTGFKEAIFNYNTIESTLLFCSVLVVLSGLMFQSETIKPGTKFELGLTAWTYLVVAFSVVFFVVVVGTEIFVGLGVCDSGKARKLLGVDGDKDSDSESDDEDEVQFEHNAAAGEKTNPMFAGNHAVAGLASKAHVSARDVKAREDTYANTIKDQKAEIRRLKQESAKRALGTHGSEQDLDYTQKTSSKNVLHPGPHHRHAQGAVSRTQQQQADSEMHV